MSFTSHAKLTGKSLVSKRVTGAAPDSPAISASHDSSTVFPSGLTMPSPVITTLRRPELIPPRLVPPPLTRWSQRPGRSPPTRSIRSRSAVSFFSLSSWELALILFAVVGGVTAAGVLLGRRLREHHETLREPFGVLQAALLGLVGLI